MKKFLRQFIILCVVLIGVPHFVVSAATGDLVKGSLSAVYYVTADGKRMPFPDEATYFSWYADFNGVKTVSDADLAALPLAGLVTMRPGIRIVKTESSPKVYAVAHGGTLRWLSTEAMAQMIFGADWVKKIVIIPDAFLTAYKYGIDITGAGQYWWAKERDASPNITLDLDASKAPDATPAVTPPTSEPPATTPTTSTGPTAKNVLFILWDPKRLSDPAPDKAALERVVFGAVPSVADYYKNESNNHVQIVKAGVLGWYSADKQPEHYWSDDPLIHAGDGFKTGAAERVAEAVKKADVDFDFKKYDVNGDGKLTVDELAVFVVIPESGDPVDDIVNVYSSEDPAQVPMTVDGVALNTVGELYVGNPLGNAPEFGAIIHCFAKHIFGLQDISVTNGSFSLMSNPHADLRIDPYNRIKLGWVTPKLIPKVQEESSQQLISIETSRTAIRIDRDQPGGPGLGTEYFLIENRERGNYDNSLPDTGLAIWDINGGSINLVRLNSTSPLDDTHALWHLGDPTAYISQELHWMDGARSGVRLLNLGYPDPVMNFNLEKKILTEMDLRPLPSPIQ